MLFSMNSPSHCATLPLPPHRNSSACNPQAEASPKKAFISSSIGASAAFADNDMPPPSFSRHVSPESTGSIVYMPYDSAARGVQEDLALSRVSSHSTKRGRSDGSDSEEGSSRIEEIASAFKKSREHVNLAPRHVPAFIGAMGSLAAGSILADAAADEKMNGTSRHQHHLGSNLLRVHLRKQLSVGRLEPFLGGDHDAMDVDTEATTKMRSMSF
jgi:hypothetical protein